MTRISTASRGFVSDSWAFLLRNDRQTSERNNELAGSQDLWRSLEGNEKAVGLYGRISENSRRKQSGGTSSQWCMAVEWGVKIMWAKSHGVKDCAMRWMETRYTSKAYDFHSWQNDILCSWVGIFRGIMIVQRCEIPWNKLDLLISPAQDIALGCYLSDI